jgi:hypothetical protein
MSNCVVNTALLQPVLHITGTAITTNQGVYNNILNSNVESANAFQIVWIDSSTYGLPQVLNGNSMSYGDSTAKTNLVNVSCAVLVDAPAASVALVYLLNNYINLQGCTNATPAFNETNSTAANYYFNSGNSSQPGLNAGVVGVLNTSKFSLVPCV